MCIELGTCLLCIRMMCAALLGRAYGQRYINAKNKICKLIFVISSSKEMYLPPFGNFKLFYFSIFTVSFERKIVIHEITQ